MSFHWSSLMLALVLVLTPVPLLYGAKTKYRALDRHWMDVLHLVLLLPWHWIDLARAICGCLVLQVAFTLPAVGNISGPVATVLAHGGVLLAGVLLDALLCKKPGGANAPFAYVVGVIFGLYPVMLASLALALGITVASGLRRAGAFFLITPIGLYIFGLLLYDPSLLLLITIGGFLTATPFVLPLLFDRHLLLAHFRIPNADVHETAIRKTLQRDAMRV